MDPQKVENIKIDTMLKNWGIHMCETVVAESPAQLFPLLSFGAVHEFAVVLPLLWSPATTTQQFFNVLNWKFFLW